MFSAEPGEPPYPEMMNSGAIAEIGAIDPAAVIVKGDLTADGQDDEYAAFRRFYGGAFGDRLHTVRGNHDGYRGQTYEMGDREIVLPGVRVLLLDTVIPFETTGRITQDQLAWVDDLAADERSARHGDGPPPAVESRLREAQPHLLRHQPRRLRRPGRRDPTATRHPRLLRRAHPSQPRAPLQRHRDDPVRRGRLREGLPGHLGRVPRATRAASSKCTVASRRPKRSRGPNKTRAMFAGFYETYAFGELSDRCFTMEAA